jgi:hypothetical protein
VLSRLPWVPLPLWGRLWAALSPVSPLSGPVRCPGLSVSCLVLSPVCLCPLTRFVSWSVSGVHSGIPLTGGALGWGVPVWCCLVCVSGVSVLVCLWGPVCSVPSLGVPWAGCLLSGAVPGLGCLRCAQGTQATAAQPGVPGRWTAAGHSLSPQLSHSVPAAAVTAVQQLAAGQRAAEQQSRADRSRRRYCPQTAQGTPGDGRKDSWPPYFSRILGLWCQSTRP